MTLRPDMALSNLIVYPESDRIMYINDPARGKIPMWKHTDDGWVLNVYNAVETGDPEYYLGNGVVRNGTFKITAAAQSSTSYTFTMETATASNISANFAWDPILEVYKHSLGGVDTYMYVKAMKDEVFQLYIGDDLAAMHPSVPVTKTSP